MQWQGREVTTGIFKVNVEGRRWLRKLGFEGEHMEVIIDLEEVQPIHRIESRYYQDILQWIFLPEKVEYFVSEDGESFQQVATGGEHTCGILTDGTVECWGSNGSGRSTPPAGSWGWTGRASRCAA